MQIFINDTPTTCAENSTLQDILAANDLPVKNIAIALDNTVVPKAQWISTFVKDGSHIIIIKAVQGG